jgi:hypothetical protein
MKIKANIGFVGLVSMMKGEIKEVADEIGRDLITAGHAEEVQPKKRTRTTTKKEKE